MFHPVGDPGVVHDFVRCPLSVVVSWVAQVAWADSALPYSRDVTEA
jgi:hypothetical protein